MLVVFLLVFLPPFPPPLFLPFFSLLDHHHHHHPKNLGNLFVFTSFSSSSSPVASLHLTWFFCPTLSLALPSTVCLPLFPPSFSFPSLSRSPFAYAPHLSLSLYLLGLVLSCSSPLSIATPLSVSTPSRVRACVFVCLLHCFSAPLEGKKNRERRAGRQAGRHVNRGREGEDGKGCDREKGR